MILETLSKIIHPAADKDIVSLGLVEDIKLFDGNGAAVEPTDPQAGEKAVLVRFKLVVPSPDPLLSSIKKQCEEAMAAEFPHAKISIIELVRERKPTKKTVNDLDDTQLQNIGKIIAIASGKGRRTLYTYFKNKEDLYSCVVKSELDKLYNSIKAVSELDIPPDDKIIEMIYTHLDVIKKAVLRNGSLRGDFFRDINKVELVRRTFDNKEMRLLYKVLQEGKDAGIFEIDNVGMLATLIHYAVKGMEVPHIRGAISPDMDKKIYKVYVRKIVFGALRRKKMKY